MTNPLETRLARVGSIAARLQRAALLRIGNNEQPGAILDRAAGGHELRLAEDRAPGRFRDPLQLDEWGIADRLDDSVTELHRRTILKREWTLDD